MVSQEVTERMSTHVYFEALKRLSSSFTVSRLAEAIQLTPVGAYECAWTPPAPPLTPLRVSL